MQISCYIQGCLVWNFPHFYGQPQASLLHWQPYSAEYTICMRLAVNYCGSDLSHCTTIILQLLTNVFGLFIFTLYMALKVLVHSNRQEYYRSTDETWECPKQLFYLTNYRECNNCTIPHHRYWRQLHSLSAVELQLHDPSRRQSRLESHHSVENIQQNTGHGTWCEVVSPIYNNINMGS